MSSSAIVTPVPSKPGSATPATRRGRARPVGAGRERRRKGDAHRVDAGDLGVVLEQRDRARVERGREAVEDARVAVVGPRRRARGARARVSTCCCAASASAVQRRSGRLGREAGLGEALRRPTASSGRRSSRLPSATAGRDVADEAAPGAGAGVAARRRRRSASRGRSARRRRRSPRASSEDELRPPTHTHRAQGTRATGAAVV